MTARSSSAAPPPPRAAPASSTQSAPTCPSRPHTHAFQQYHLLITVRLAAGVVHVPLASSLTRKALTAVVSSVMLAGTGTRLEKAIRARHFGGVIVLTVEKASACPRMWQAQRAGAVSAMRRMCWQPAGLP